MPTVRNPRRGTLQFWPRKRAKRHYARVRNGTAPSVKILSGFAGYKAGMTHVLVTDNRKESMTFGMEITMPVTIIECPPVKISSIRAYKKTFEGLKLAKESWVKVDKELERKVAMPKKESLADLEKEIENYDEIRLNVYTQPKLTGIGKKKPELFEIKIGGKDVKEKLAYAKELIGKEIKISDVFKEGQLVDTYAVTKGKGVQGPIKRHGVSLKQHKSEKGVRRPANLGAWTGNRSWTVAHAGQTGYHQRMEKNKWVLKIGEKAEEVTPKGGFINYGTLRNSYIILRGSIQGPAKRIIRMEQPQRSNKLIPDKAPSIEMISTSSKS